MSLRSPTDRVEELYFNWVCDRVLLNSFTENIYTNLGLRLYRTEFFYYVHMDENRVLEALSMRRLPEVEALLGEEVSLLHPIPSVLEVLVALAIRWESYISYDPEKGDQVPSHFFEMLNNLNLLNASDGVYCEEMDMYVHTVLQDFMNRHYNYDGTGGGLFPIYDADTRPNFRDQRTRELWMQLNDYVAKDYL